MKKVTLLLSVLIALTLSTSLSASDDDYECDGRQYCSQMESCEEAKFFLDNCPNPKMDGNNDGIPCEKQWCYGSALEKIQGY